MRCQLLRCRFSFHPLSEVKKEERGRREKSEEERESCLKVEQLSLCRRGGRRKGAEGEGQGKGQVVGEGVGQREGQGVGWGQQYGEDYNACFGGALEFPAGPPQSATGPVGTKDKVF